MREPSAPKKIFVYGTLMKGFYNYERALAGQEVSQVPARIRGRVWHMTNRGYPAVKEGDGWVYGELVELKDFAAVIDTMDNIEGYYGPGDIPQRICPHPFPSRKSGDRSHRRSICVLLCPG